MRKKYAILHIPSGTYLKSKTDRYASNSSISSEYFSLFIAANKAAATLQIKNYIKDSNTSPLWSDDEIVWFHSSNTNRIIVKHVKEEFEIVEAT